MIRSLLIGMVGGMRSMTPLAAVSFALRHGVIPRNNGAPALLSSRAAEIGTMALAAGELFGDKLRSAPDRTVPPGIAARVVTGAVTGAALAPHHRRTAGALLGAAGAIGTAYLTLSARKQGIRRYGQMRSGLFEDAIMMVATALIVNGTGRRR